MGHKGIIEPLKKYTSKYLMDDIGKYLTLNEDNSMFDIPNLLFKVFVNVMYMNRQNCNIPK